MISRRFPEGDGFAKGETFVLVWAVVGALATLIYGRLRGCTVGGALFLTMMALVLLPLLIFIVLVVAFASCNCNVGGDRPCRRWA